MLPRLRSQLDDLFKQHAAFAAETQALSDEQLRFRPAAGAWSIAEVAQHVFHVEREVTRAAAKPGVERRGRGRTIREWIGFALFLAIVHFNVRIRIPEKVVGRVTPNSEPEMAPLWRQWDDVHASLERFLETVTPGELSDMAFKHPIMGPTTVRGMLPFLLKHFNHHMRQVERIRRSAGFARG